VKHFARYHLPAIIYAILILVLSSIPELGPKQKFLIGYDKVIHFCEYAVFAVLIFRSLSHLTMKISFRLSLLISLTFIVLFAALDEFYQGLVPGRETDIYDALFDIMGAVLIVVILAIRKKYSKKKDDTALP
jgi:VanZ family protein